MLLLSFYVSFFFFFFFTGWGSADMGQVQDGGDGFESIGAFGLMD